MYIPDDCKKEQHDRDVMNAKSELIQIKAAMVLAENNDLGCEIHIAGLTIGVCNNSKILPVLRHNKKEIEKFLKGQPNEWE